MSSIIVPFLLKVDLKKEESEESQKEVEMALLALGNFWSINMLKELYINEIKEIIEYHQEHHNLTQLSNQSAWEFLIDRFFFDHSLEHVIVNELHFCREAAKELEELSKCVDGKRKEGWKGGKETKEELLLMKWIKTLWLYFRHCKLWNEDFAELIGSVAHVCRAARENNKEISNQCIHPLRNAAENRVVKVEELFKGGAIDAVLEEFQQQTLNEGRTNECFHFFMNVSRKLKQKNKDEREEEERKSMKKKVFEKMEEEGYEDIFNSFHKKLFFLNIGYQLSLSIFDYFVYV